MRAAIYLRISADRAGEGLGVARQRADCQQLCATKNWTPVEYCDNDISAASGKRRPAYEQLLADIRDGRISAVVAWDLDRLHRRPAELEAFVTLADGHGVALATVSGDVDLATPQGRLIARLKGSVAAHEIEQMRVRQLAAAKQRAQRGRPKWRKAFGYLPYTGTADADTGAREPDPATAPLVRQAYTALLAGSSLGDIARTLNTHGALGLNGKPWTASTMSLFLRAPRNAGLRDYHGDIVGPGTWVPLVDETLWRAAQAVLTAPGRAPGRKSVRKHLLTGVLRCGNCGHHLAGQWAPPPTGYPPGRRRNGTPNLPPTQTHQITYVCRKCRGNSVRAGLVEPLLADLVAARLARPDAARLLRAPTHDPAEAEKLRLESATLAARLDEIADERADGLLTGAQAARATDRIRHRLAGIEAQQTDHERLRIFDQIPLGEPEVADVVRALTPDRYRAVLDVLMTVTVMPVGKAGSTFNPDRVVVEWM